MTKLALSLIATGALTLGMAATAQTSTSANAQNSQIQTQTRSSVSVTTQIEKIQNAPTQERVELMNQLKEQIAAMSPDQRRETMQQLRVQMRSQEGNEHGRDQKVMEKVEEMLAKMENHQMQGEAHNMQGHQEQMQEHAHEMQQNAYREMERNEHMNQREAGEQFKEQMQGHVETPMQGQFENTSGDMEGPMGRH